MVTFGDFSRSENINKVPTVAISLNYIVHVQSNVKTLPHYSVHSFIAISSITKFNCFVLLHVYQLAIATVPCPI